MSNLLTTIWKNIMTKCENMRRIPTGPHSLEILMIYKLSSNGLVVSLLVLLIPFQLHYQHLLSHFLSHWDSSSSRSISISYPLLLLSWHSSSSRFNHLPVVVQGWHRRENRIINEPIQLKTISFEVFSILCDGNANSTMNCVFYSFCPFCLY